MTCHGTWGFWKGPFVGISTGRKDLLAFSSNILSDLMKVAAVYRLFCAWP